MRRSSKRQKIPFSILFSDLFSSLEAMLFSDSLFSKIKQSNVKQHIKTLKELNVDFVADFNTFSVEMPMISNIYNPEMDSLLNYELKSMARKLPA